LDLQQRKELLGRVEIKVTRCVTRSGTLRLFAARFSSLGLLNWELEHLPPRSRKIYEICCGGGLLRPKLDVTFHIISASNL
jgi:hypothetical protein